MIICSCLVVASLDELVVPVLRGGEQLVVPVLADREQLVVLVLPLAHQLVVPGLGLGDEPVAGGLTLADVLVVQALGHLEQGRRAGAPTHCGRTEGDRGGLLGRSRLLHRHLLLLGRLLLGRLSRLLLGGLSRLDCLLLRRLGCCGLLLRCRELLGADALSLLGLLAGLVGLALGLLGLALHLLSLLLGLGEALLRCRGTLLGLLGPGLHGLGPLLRALLRVGDPALRRLLGLVGARLCGLLGLLRLRGGSGDPRLGGLLGLVSLGGDRGEAVLRLAVRLRLGLFGRLGVRGLRGGGVGVGLGDGRHALGLAALVELVAEVVALLDDAAHLGHDLVEEVVDLPLVVATPELRRREVLVEDVLRRERHVVTSVGWHEQCR